MTLEYVVATLLTAVLISVIVFFMDQLLHGHHHHHPPHEEQEEIRLLHQILIVLREIRHELRPKRLSVIKIRFGGRMQGPVTLTVGQRTKATVVGFDQFGAVFTGLIPPVSYSLDNPALDSATDDGANGSDIVSLAAGVANLTASLTTAEGTQLSDTETITNTEVVQVLSSVKIDFSTPV